jgi:hypothetical protein
LPPLLSGKEAFFSNSDFTPPYLPEEETRLVFIRYCARQPDRTPWQLKRSDWDHFWAEAAMEPAFRDLLKNSSTHRKC